MRRLLYKWHIWLGWLVGVPLLIWTLSGLVMVAQPIESVRGEYLRAEPIAVDLGGITPIFPRIDGRVRDVADVQLVQRSDGPIWVIHFADGGGRTADAATGRYLPFIDSARAAALAEAVYAGEARLASVRRFPADASPLDLRQPRPSWRASFADGARIYLDAETGETLAIRTDGWRMFDFMWGLHIMDLETREDTSHPILIVFAAISLISILIALVILPWRYIRKRRTRAR